MGSAIEFLGEPTNDLDVDMLAAMEDLLDSWPGTLLVVSHDRYLLERVTDQQYAILDGRLRHVPGGVDEYLRLRADSETGRPGDADAGGGGQSVAAAPGSGSASDAASGSGTGGGCLKPGSAEHRAAGKEAAAIERKMERLEQQVAALQEEMAAHDPADFEGLAALGARQEKLRADQEKLEERWLELAERLG